ncbi:hypothetical protein FCK90_10515 [Kocuria coralli]|uniref:Integral membrane protein n=1 Tax=Kocuria coralli TaxID=1461025 RepID=A0A5J5KVU1_9MICC|nr:DUF6112 family protein [Kocuria coralli]KAA9393837.1 hypothetical protein FCK90_10515 [Kocuria coralli]
MFDITSFAATVDVVPHLSHVASLVHIGAAGFDPGVTPSMDGPLANPSQKVVSWIVTVVLISFVAVIAIGALVWGIGSLSKTPAAKTAGLVGILIGVGGAVVAGAGSTIVYMATSWNLLEPVTSSVGL